MNSFQSQIGGISVPDDLDVFLKKTMKKYSARKVSKRVCLCLAVAVTLLAALAVTCCASPKAAETLSKMPLVGSLFKSFTDKDLTAAHDSGLTQVIDQRQSDGDLTVTVSELYCDQTDLSVGLSLEYDNPPDNMAFEVRYNGQCVNDAWSGGLNTAKNGCAYLLDLPLKVELPDQCTVQFVAYEQAGLKRRFTFDIAVDTSLAKEQSKEVEINQTFTEDDRTLLVKRIVFSPYATTVYYDYTSPDGGGSDVRLLDGGKKLTFKSCFDESWGTQGDLRTESRVAVFGSMKGIPDSLTLQILQFNKDDPTNSPVLMSEAIPLDTG